MARKPMKIVVSPNHAGWVILVVLTLLIEFVLSPPTLWFIPRELLRSVCIFLLLLMGFWIAGNAERVKK
jgi:hypothetical protein